MRTNRLITRTLVVLLVLTAFAPLIAGEQTSAQERDNIIIGVTDFPFTLDPAFATDFPSWELMRHVYTGLTRQQPGTLNYELALATDHVVSADGLTHSYAIGDGAAFDDGTPITARTFVDSLQRVINLGRNGADLVNRYIAGVSEADDNRVVFTLISPLPDFDALVGLPVFYPQHPNMLETDADRSVEYANQGGFVGNGAYQVKTFWPQQEIALVASNTDAGVGLANEQITLRMYSLPIELRRALEANEVDAAWRALSTPDLAAITDVDGITIERQPNLQAFYLLLNHNLTSLGNLSSFDDPAIREGLAWLLNREDIIQRGLDGAGTPLYTVVPPQFDVPQISYPGFDAVRADTFLEAAGYRERRKPVNMSLYTSTENYGSVMGSAVQTLRRWMGESKIVRVSGIQDDQTDTFVRVIQRGEYLAAIVGWNPTYASPAGYLMPLLHSSFPIASAAGFASASIDTALNEIALASSGNNRDAAYEDLLDYLLRNHTLLPLWQAEDVIAYQEGLEGIQIETNGWLHYDTLSR